MPMMATTRIAEQPDLQGFKVIGVEEGFGEFTYLWAKGTEVGRAAMFRHVVLSDDEPVSEWYANDLAHAIYMEDKDDGK